MSVLTLPVLPVVGASDAKSVAAEGAPVTQGASSDATTQASFPAVLAKVNQQGSTPKAASSGKEPSGGVTVPVLPNDEIEGEGTSGVFGTQGIQNPLLSPPPAVLEGVPLPTENGLVLALASNGTGESNAEFPSLIGVSPELTKSTGNQTENQTENSGVTLRSTRLSPIGSVNVSFHGEGESGGLLRVPILNSPSGNSGPQLAPLQSLEGKEVSAPALLRDSASPIPFASRLPLSNVPLSFVNGASLQGPVVGDTLTPSPLSQSIPQAIPPILSSTVGTNGTIGHDAPGSGSVSLVGKGEGETGGTSLGFEQRGHQENGGAFSPRQQAAGHTLAGESGPKFQITESQLAARPEPGIERSRAMNVFSQQRMQLDVILSDETKVQVDVLVKNQSVTAQLMTDQLMLRNLALQHEPHLDAQLSSVGLELKQFGAEVNEQGLFGQHLSDSSGQDSPTNSNGSEADDASVPQEGDVLVGAGVEEDGRFHFVA